MRRDRGTSRWLVVGTLALIAACSDGGSSPRPSDTAAESTVASDPTSGPIAHATGAADVLIRVGRYQNDNTDRFTRGPTFTLYGDGTVIQGEWLTWRSNRLDEAQIQEVLRLARSEGLFDPPYRHQSPIVPTGTDQDLGLIVYLNFDGKSVEQRIDGDPAFDEAKPIVEFADRLRTLGVGEPQSGWEPTEYYALIWDPACRLVETEQPPPDAFYYAWPILPDVADVPVEQIFRC